MSNKEKFIGEAPLSESPKGKLKFIIPDKTIKNKHLDDDSVDTRVIEDKSVTPTKLSDSIQGVWLGENIIQQKALIIKMLDSEDRNIPIPHLGYYIKDGKYNVFKYMVDFVEEMDEK